MNDAVIKLTYVSDITGSEMNLELDKIWQELKTKGKLWEKATQNDIDIDQLLNEPRIEIVNVDNPDSNFDPITTALVTLAGKMAYDLWEHILLPRIIEKYGPNKLKKSP